MRLKLFKLHEATPLHRVYAVCFAMLFILVAAGFLPAQQAAGERISFNQGWLFMKGDPSGIDGRLDYEKIKVWLAPTGSDLVLFAPAKPVRPEGNLGGDVAWTLTNFDDKSWRRLDLPHDWGIEGPFKQELPGETGKLPWSGVGWYRKHFAIPTADEGKRLFLDMDGAMAYSTVWLNGQFVGGWPYGYSSYRLDLTPYLKIGTENVVAVRLDNPPESSRWYPGGGIYRNVWLIKTAAVHVAHWGVFVTTPVVSKDSAIVNVSFTLDNQSGSDAEAQVSTRVFEVSEAGKKTGDPVAAAAQVSVRISAGRQSAGSQSLTVADPRLWSLKQRNQYAAEVTVAKDGKALDVFDALFGIRTMAFIPDKGFFLNGEPVKLNGVCMHHDLGALGSAVHISALERQISILQEMGCNAIRTSHNPPAPELLDLCDRMGMLVMDEAFDCWKSGKKKNDYSRVFVDWHEKDLRALARRDRNHPCVVLWSIGNEISEQREPEGWKLATHLAGLVREEDRTRLVTAGFNHVQSGYNGFHEAVDVVGFNYKPAEYGTFHGRSPRIPVVGSETSSCISSRGEYFFPVTENKAEGKADFQMSSYDLYAPRWANVPDLEFKGLDEFPFTAGEFVWTGFDYLGEPTPYGGDAADLPTFTDPAKRVRAEKELKESGKIRVPSRSSYFGIVDLAGFKKDRFFMYQARWRPELPMAHILPHWTWPGRKGQITPVHVTTSGDEAELFLNGKSLGRKRLGSLQYRLRWDDVVYEPGELLAVAYKNGVKWAEDKVKTAGPPSRITLSADRASIKADGRDLVFVTVSISDKDGAVVPRSKNPVQFTVSGPGEILAVDNGDATSFEPFRAMERKAYNGLCLAIVRSKPGDQGTVVLKAQSKGLKSAEIRITAQAGE
jgi:beta-galactosidase